MAERKGQVFVDDLSEQLSCTYNGFCGASEQEVGVHVTCRFRVDSSIILKFIALRVEMVLFLKFFFSGRTIRKVKGGGGIFEPQEFFFFNVSREWIFFFLVKMLCTNIFFP